MHIEGKIPLSSPKNITILVPGQQGGIDRLFQHLSADENKKTQKKFVLFETHLFETHGPLLQGILLFPFRLARFFSLCLLGKIDLCHINVASNGSTLRKVIYAVICRLFGIPYVIHLHGASYVEFLDRLPKALFAVVQSFFNKADRVIVLGTYWRGFIIDRLEVDPRQVVILPNGVAGPHREKGPSRKQPPIIAFLGRLGERKGVPELIKALGKLDKTSLQWTAILAGDGPVEDYRQRLVEEGIEDRVTLTGWMGANDVKTLLEEATILALPSHAENLPLSMLEGMAYGLCPVVTPVGAVRDVIKDGENGILVPVGDDVALAAALQDLLEHPKKCARLAQNAQRTFADGYDITEYYDKLEDIYVNI